MWKVVLLVVIPFSFLVTMGQFCQLLYQLVQPSDGSLLQYSSSSNLSPLPTSAASVSNSNTSSLVSSALSSSSSSSCLNTQYEADAYLSQSLLCFSHAVSLHCSPKCSRSSMNGQSSGLSLAGVQLSLSSLLLVLAT